MQIDIDNLFNKFKVCDKEIKINNLNCDYCKSDSLIVDNGYTVCTNCSQQSDRKYIDDENIEWRYYGVKDSKRSDPTRCGAPINAYLPKSFPGK